MNEKQFQKKIITATKWSSLTELAAKLMLPITTIILARILVPEDFGIIATITMIISFADMFTDSGFQKYLVQNEFESEKEKNDSANVAFWTNLLVSIILWFLIFLLKDEIASLVGSPGIGNVLAIAGLQLPLTAFSSIQTALYRRSFNFKTLFWVRMISVLVPFLITIPLALIGFSYWSLIIGTLVVQVINAIVLTAKSVWKPSFFYDFQILKKMFSFSVWSLFEAISIWLTIWVDTFVIGAILNEYYLGLYKTSTTMVNTLMALITAATIPVLFSALSRLQNDDYRFKELFFKFQRIVSIFVFPLGIGIYLYSDLATLILLGDQWGEASTIIGVWALSSSLMIVYGQYSSEVYRAKGKPKLSLLAQVLHLIVLIPVLIISSKYGFWILVFARSWVRMQFVLVHFIIMKFVIGISIKKTLINVFPTLISAIAMGGIGYFIQTINENLIWQLFSIICCIILYFLFLSLFPNLRKEIMQFKKILK